MSLAGRRIGAAAGIALLGLLEAPLATGHSGPPYPVVSDRMVGAYRLSLWTDPDATDDLTPGGQFWVIVHAADGSAPGADTRVSVAARPLDRPGTVQRATAAPQESAPSRYFAALLLDHEGNWQIEVLLEGPRGSASTTADVPATYDLRPSLGTLPFLVLPFLLIGFLWVTALRKGRRRRIQ